VRAILCGGGAPCLTVTMTQQKAMAVAIASPCRCGRLPSSAASLAALPPTRHAVCGPVHRSAQINVPKNRWQPAGRAARTPPCCAKVDCQFGW